MVHKLTRILGDEIRTVSFSTHFKLRGEWFGKGSALDVTVPLWQLLLQPRLLTCDRDRSTLCDLYFPLLLSLICAEQSLFALQTISRPLSGISCVSFLSSYFLFGLCSWNNTLWHLTKWTVEGSIRHLMFAAKSRSHIRAYSRPDSLRWNAVKWKYANKRVHGQVVCLNEAIFRTWFWLFAVLWMSLWLIPPPISQAS
jgi:hypothetical protein